RPVPYTGGGAIFFSFTLVFLIVGFFKGQYIVEVIGIFFGSLIVTALGFLDDFKKLRPVFRLSGQILAALALIIVGLRIQFIPNFIICIPLTIFYVVASCNSLNLLDGMDGLVAGIVSIASVGLLCLSIIQGNSLAIMLSLIVLGSGLGFLPYNSYPASIFMGDAGSNFLGFILATIMILLTSKPYDVLSFVAPILVMGLPILDTSLAIARRYRSKQRFHEGDREHLYDRIYVKGFSQRQTVFICYGIGVLFASLSIFLVALS
ncbi:MAG: MraY family glycosyltransferase, partial [Thermodesulfobacteriota bacterium]